ncbi:hypothetical protein Rxyl_0556 [Rubrobacter xylanophilus DSM 9941]|uniref:Uncharacterized protein n=1 Tax=Rubrobacter xylanophilus (strain DSM 9941 / JCM 11954 / NBRC 16129 / PRD-1) TaxID=266117 RepID=Q1AYJ8_RUBXD|nr:hypothetical protein Rxyl_0556 [Rubrobacter xylanophilus DSM 9941]
MRRGRASPLSLGPAPSSLLQKRPVVEPLEEVCDLALGREPAEEALLEEPGALLLQGREHPASPPSGGSIFPGRPPGETSPTCSRAPL